MFKITDHIEFDSSLRAVCPSCEADGKGKKKNLALVPGTDGAYKCHRGCSTEDIRAALGQEKPRQIPTALAQPQRTSTSVPPQRIAQDHALMSKSSKALEWLNARGITEEAIAHFKLGIARSKAGSKHIPSISIPIPNATGTQYWRKKRIAPWLTGDDRPADAQDWSQYGIPQQVFFTHKPDGADCTYLCEGEWDAIRLGWEMRADPKVAIACFTCGCGSAPAPDELDRMPGDVVIFYDQDEPGRKGAKKLADRLGTRSKVATVPTIEGSEEGWDITDALNVFEIKDIHEAAAKAERWAIATKKNDVQLRMITNAELIDRAADYIDWLVPELLTCDELFVLGMPPRGGKSLWCMTLAKAIATGGKFLDRPVTQGSVLYVNLEDGDAKIKTRQISQGWDRDLPVYWLDKFKLTELPDLGEAIDEIGDVRLVVLDTFSRVRSDGMKETGAEMGQVLEPLQEMCKAKNVCAILTHHLSKGTIEKDQNPFDLLRGSGSIRATARGSMVIIPADNCYRLIAENGHTDNMDLRIRINPATLEWRLLGNWEPRVDGDMKDQILDHLNLIGEATVTEVAKSLNFKASSVSTILYRLQADDMVIKVGGKGPRPARYMRSANYRQQLDSLLAVANPDGESDTALRQQKEGYREYSDQSDHSALSDQNSMITSEEMITLSPDKGNCWRKDSKPSTAGDTKRQQGDPLLALDGASNCHTLKPGDQVRYVGQNWQRERICGRKKLIVESIAEDIAVVNHTAWRFTQSIAVSELAIAK
ncbi:MAG: hypothetical protein DCF15_10445 [Phormidesmis priestleyi]|uniref:AAA+ ATPase domain-containing protein n=1 Tax=Phormidesmis priestleyi TaxID=268141 RepID=A0A2W4XDW7_9CYAN|nr:MAG: hypothetical protein DCF15_10445 [Phormidesmis priestleyi]